MADGQVTAAALLGRHDHHRGHAGRCPEGPREVLDAKRGQLADLELPHRRQARCEDRIRCAKDTGLRNLPLKGFAANQLWCEIVALACELLAWTQMIALAGQARRWEPRRLRLRLFSVAGRLVRGGRRLRLRLAERWPWADQVTAAIGVLQALPAD